MMTRRLAALGIASILAAATGNPVGAHTPVAGAQAVYTAGSGALAYIPGGHLRHHARYSR
jgi:hypothetical protein